MMWKTLGRYVIIKIEAKYPERLLNALRRHGIGVFDVSFPARGALLLRMRAEDFFRLRAVRRSMRAPRQSEQRSREDDAARDHRAEADQARH